ncbi:SpoIID/LytB domain-containing protein [Nocardioides sp. zg-1228]|uniref:SpoIID/LytB domain-containing protein n=1 Tax=Nocardioides sp. zg-1228 TaxID=2763008 RepID=UPI0016433E72|nr:SpoIID/LytB domain-containing protein [Nocardioides sp. zg-1228]MBC2933786.1 SpoIID/LytB domain-containing protein [Nocardioides sp. zg-1228]QSF58562.1 SpoIID/LytB domain-containing protein [Nocardioides sp. zg-1228]
MKTRSRLLPLALAVSALLLPAAVSAPASAEPRQRVEAWSTPGSTAITITGHGYGHGRGMSQYGALGAAQQGLTWQQINEFYYPGTTWGQVRGKLRVLITADTGRDVQVVAERGLKVTSLGRGRTWRIPQLPAKKWRLIAQGDRTAVQRTKGGGWRTWKTFRGEGEFRAADGRLTLVLPGGRRDYRGTLQSVAARQGGKRQTVNRIGMEAYLRGVVPEEVPALWEPAAVSAQSVAARTYAAFERSHPAAPHYDLCDTALCQVYGGADVEHPSATAAIRATARQGLFHGGRPAFTQFSASNGGFSSAGSMPYLVAQADPYDGLANPTYATWSTTVDDTQVEKHWPDLGDLTGIEVVSRDGNGDWGGRVTEMAFVFTGGRATVSGDTVRSYLGLYSDWFTFAVTPRQNGPARP